MKKKLAMLLAIATMFTTVVGVNPESVMAHTYTKVTQIKAQDASDGVKQIYDGIYFGYDDLGYVQIGKNIYNRKGESVLPRYASSSTYLQYRDGLIYYTYYGTHYMYSINTGKCIEVGSCEFLGEGIFQCWKGGEGTAYYNSNLEQITEYGRYAYIDDNYVDVSDYEFYDGLARVKSLDGLYGFINSKGEEVVECAYNYLGFFHEGLAYAKTDSGIGYVNKKGELVIGYKNYSSVGDFSDGMAWVKNDKGEVGYIDKTGKEVIKCQYLIGDGYLEDKEADFNNGIAILKVGNKYGVINKKGKIVYKFSDLVDIKSVLNNKLLYAQGYTEGRLINNKGKCISKEYDFWTASELTGYIALKDKKSDKYVFLNETGKVVSKIGKFGGIRALNDKMFGVNKVISRDEYGNTKRKYGIVQVKNGKLKKGKIKYDDFNYGNSEKDLFYGRIGNKYEFINENGKVIHKGTYKSVYLRKNVAKVCKEDKRTGIDVYYYLVFE